MFKCLVKEIVFCLAHKLVGFLTKSPSPLKRLASLFGSFKYKMSRLVWQAIKPFGAAGVIRVKLYYLDNYQH